MGALYKGRSVPGARGLSIPRHENRRDHEQCSARSPGQDGCGSVAAVANEVEPKAKNRVSLGEVFPRWKLCVLIFFGLTAITVFLPPNSGWLTFCLVSIVACWRGYREPKFPAWSDAIRLGLLGVLIGSLLWSFANPLQRNGLIRLSRDVHLSSPDRFMCCVWDGKSIEPKQGQRPR